MRIYLICTVNSTDKADLCLRYWALAEDGTWAESVECISVSYGLQSSELTLQAMEHSTAYIPRVRCIGCSSPVKIKTRPQYTHCMTYEISNNGDYMCSKCKFRIVASYGKF